MKTVTFLGLVLLIAPTIAFAEEPREKPANAVARGTASMEGHYASVNGLRMYYEIHGTGRPLVVLHGAFGWATVFPELAQEHQVIAVELQGHGRTNDIDRPLTYEQMADDVATLLKEIGIEQADIFGYSMGGTVALAVAIRHPSIVGKVVINGSHFAALEEAYEAESARQFSSLPPDFAPPILKDAYDRLSPDPKQWPTLVAKIKKMGAEFKGFAREDLQAIQAQFLITVGDRDVVRPEHAVEMYRLIPNSQLAVFPGADHFMLFQSPQRLLPTVIAFLDAPAQEANKPAGN